MPYFNGTMIAKSNFLSLLHSDHLINHRFNSGEALILTNTLKRYLLVTRNQDDTRGRLPCSEVGNSQ